MKTLREHLKEPIDKLDKLIVGFNLQEIKEEFKSQRKENWEEREKDDKYWSGVVEEKKSKIKELNKRTSSLKGQIKSAVDRKNWWKNKSKDDANCVENEQ